MHCNIFSFSSNYFWQLPKKINTITSTTLNTNGITRTFYIATEEVEWDYAPTDINQIMNAPFGTIENTYLQNDTNRCGNKNIKA